MNALEVMRIELKSTQLDQADCITSTGYVKPESRYEYQKLTRKAADIRDGILFMEELEAQRWQKDLLSV